MLKDHELKDKFLVSLTELEQHKFHTAETLSEKFEVSVERATNLLKEIYSDHRCSRLPYPNRSYKDQYTPNKDTTAFLATGGYTKIQEQIDADSAFNKRKDEVDLRTKEFVFKYRWLPYIFSAIAFIVSVIGLSVSIATCNKKTRPTQQVQNQTKQLTIPTVDTPKKHR